MPAYRSDAEAEIRSAAVDRLRQLRPDARIIHEICAFFGGTRIDVLAVSPSEIIAVEVKSEKDKLDRLPDQIEGMRGVAHHVITAMHEKFLVEKETNEWQAHYSRDGSFFMGDVPTAAKKEHCWIYPEKQRVTHEQGYDFIAKWYEPEAAIQRPLPADAIHMLWRDELYELCGELGLAVPRRANMSLMSKLLRWSCTGRQLTRGVCRQIRKRKCIEADPPIYPEEALQQESGDE